MLLGLLLLLSAHAAPLSTLVETHPTTAVGACATASHRAELPIRLDEDALVYVEVAEWDAPVVAGLAEGSSVCHGAFSPPPPRTLAARAPRAMVRWLPAGQHQLTLDSTTPASAVVSVSIVSPRVLVESGVHPVLARSALLAADHAWTDGHANRTTLAVADFSLPSTTERLWLLDLADGTVHLHAFLSHGKGSGHPTDAARAVRFSNRPHSNQTSLGLFRASETYTGDHGRSMRLDGLEPGVNDLARDRAIVVHGAEYARVDHIAEWGYLGRSHGCPALDDRLVQGLIDALHDGGLLYAWGGPRSGDCCTLRAGTEPSPDAPYLPDPLGLVSIY